MADIPLNLDLDQYLAPSYANFPRFAEHAAYDTVLRAFVTPENVVSAEKARKQIIKDGKKKEKTRKSEPTEDGVKQLTSHELSFDNKFLIEKAKSGISRCRKCGNAIAKDTLRFGYGSPDPRGEYGAIPIWFHIRCAPLGFVGFDKFDDILASMCVGFETLTEDERKEAVETAGKPEQILQDPNPEYADDFDDEQPLSARLVHRRGVSVQLLPQPIEITGAKLLPFQQEGFSWMVAQEANSSTKGGILADEMGMGKTLQTISVIVAKRATVKPTLVVCPVAAVMQWYSEIQKFTSNSEILSVHVYHGSQKISAEKLMEFDVVLTTYQTLENEYRKQANKAKVACKYCKRMFLPGKLSFHLKYMCGPNAMRTLKQSMREIKEKGATEKAKRTMGIGSSSSSEPPTITNVLKEVVRQGGLLTDEQLAGMTHYDLMRMYGENSKPETVETKQEVQDEISPKIIDEETRQKLKKKTVAQLKEILVNAEITNFAVSIKKDDLIQMIVDNGLEHRTENRNGKRKIPDPPRAAKKQRRSFSAKPQSPSSDESSDTSEMSESDVSVKGQRKRKGKPSTALSVGRRSAALKAMSIMQSLKSSEDESEEEERKPKRNMRGRTKKIVSESESSSSSDWDSVETSSSSSSSLTDSESSSGETVEVDSDSEMDETPPPRGSVGKPKRRASKPVRTRAKGGDGMEGEDSEEDAVEDIDLNQSPLHCVKWGRLVLDEAHRIKQRTNSTSLAAFALAADYRWCLSGTPLQNRVGELYSLVRFLRFSPFAHYFCKGCDCKSLHFRFIDNRFCQKCGCARTKHYSYFKQVISGPIVKYGIGDGVALNVLKSQVLDTILLRRTKIERQADLNLPPLTVEIRKLKLTPEEHDFYESLYKQSILKFDTFAKSGTLLHNYAHIFDLLTRLRQALDHPYLIVYGADYTVPTAAKDLGRGICALCQDDIGDEPRALGSCGHKFHSDCVKEYLVEAPQLPTGGCGCPSCFVPLTVKFEDEDDTPPPGQSMLGSPEPDLTSTVASTPAETTPGISRLGIMERVGASAFQSSSKIEALVNELASIPKESKVLIFSQFTRMLDLVDFRLKQYGIGCAKLTGSLNLSQRSNILISFNSDPSIRALLISLKAGGEGLNLQAADHVFLIDPWWNPASELQAIQRAHRIGQHAKQVRAIRFVTENSVEEKVVALQEMKQLVFDATVGQSEGAEKKLNENDLRFLFQH
jgi:DNA repair protein RAD16